MRILRISLWVAPMAALTLQAAPFNVAFLPGTSPTYHNGTTFVGWDGQRYTALTEDPTAPFNDIPCIYRGYNQGGSSELLGTNRLVYRMRIDFANPVLLKSFTEVAAGGQNAGSLLRLLDGQMTLLKSVTLPRVMNALTTNVLNANVTGQSFIIDSFDCSLDWRFRRSFIIDHSPLNTGYATNIHSPVLHIRSSSNQITVTWQGMTNLHYLVERRHSLDPNAYSYKLQDDISTGTSSSSYTEPINAPVAFYTVSENTTTRPAEIMRQIETSASRIDGLAFDGSYLWSVDRQQRRVHKLDVNTGDEILSFAAPGTGNWAAGLTFYDNHLWQLDCQERRLYGLDPLGGVVQASFPLKGTSPTGLAVLAGEAYVADWVDKTIYVYQLSTGVLLRELPAPTVPIWGATTDGTYLWFVNHYGREVHVVAPARWQLVTSLPIGIEAPTGAAFDGEGIWLSNALNGTLVKLRVYADQCWMVTDSTCARHVFLRTFRNNSNNPQNLLLNSVLPIDMPNQLVDSLNSVFQPASRIVEPQPSGLRYAITQYGTINPQDYVQFAASVLLRKGVLRNVLFPHQVANIQNIPNDFCALWTNDIPEARFSLNTAIVQSAARAAVGGETNVFWMTMAIHDYVINHVRYGYPAWKPVDQVLTSGIGVCDDFARTMVALCRLNGIPARTAGGQDHVTVEVWMPGPNVWFPADPTNVSGDPDGTLWQRRVTWGRSDRVINGVLNPGWTGWQYTLWQWPGFDSYYDDYVDTVVDKNTGPIFNGFHTPPRLVNNRVTCRVYDAFDPENDYPVLYRAYVSATPDFFSTASCVFETTNSTMSIPVGNNFHPD